MILPSPPSRIESPKALLSSDPAQTVKKADSTGDKGSPQDISLARKQRPIFHHNYHIFSVPQSKCERAVCDV